MSTNKSSKRSKHRSSNKHNRDESPDHPSFFNLNNEVKMPSLGVGIHRIRGSTETIAMVDSALEAGYRMFDTSPHYGNEKVLQQALKTCMPKYSLERSDIFIITKLLFTNYGGEKTKQGIEKSLENLGDDYVDLVLVHNSKYPQFYKNNTKSGKSVDSLLQSTWKALVKEYDAGKIRALGVSNFTKDQLNIVVEYNHGVMPSVIKVEWNPYYNEKGLYEYCKENDVLILANSTLACSSTTEILEDKTIQKVSNLLKVTPSQVVLAWSMQREVAIIPKCYKGEDLVIDHYPLNFTIPVKLIKEINKVYENHSAIWEP